MNVNIQEDVLESYSKYDFDSYTDRQVLRVLEKDSISNEDFAVLLSPAALNHLEKMAQRSKKVTRKQFGSSIGLYTPLYLSNYCVNHCTYCGFNCKNKINRGTLTIDEIEMEYRSIAETGLKDILLLTGESRKHSDVEYIGKAVKLACKYFSTVGIEVYPLEIDEYSYIQKCGADFVSVYQETYDTEKYAQYHLSGPKRDFLYRFNSLERALKGGMRGVGAGALLGLGNFRKDALATGLHLSLLQKKYPHGEVSFSIPRLRPFINNSSNSSNDVYEPQLLQIMLAYRLFMPFAGISISTRERAVFRDNVIGMVATRISAGVKTGVGGHDDNKKGDEQFEISDGRSVKDIHDMIISKHLQPVYTDYLRM